MLKACFVFFACCLTPALAPASCFLVFDPAGRLVYRSVFSPIDLSQPLSQGLAAKYPGGHLTFLADESSCVGFEEIDGARPRAGALRPTRAAPASRASPPAPTSAGQNSALEASPLFRGSGPPTGRQR